MDPDIFEPKTQLTDRQLTAINKLRERARTFAGTINELSPLGSHREECWLHLERIVTLLEHEITTDRPPILTPELLSHAFRQVERWDRRVVSIYVNAHTVCHFRRAAFKDALDPTADAQEMRRGVYGWIWNAQIHIHRKVPQNAVLLIEDDNALLTEELPLPKDWEPDPDRLFHFGSGSDGVIPRWTHS